MTRAGGTAHQKNFKSKQRERCPHCHKALSDDWIRAAHSRVAGRLGGRPRMSKPCPFCRHTFSARDLRDHLPHCERNPNARGS